MSNETADRWHPRTLTVIPSDAKTLEEIAEQARHKGHAEGLLQGQAAAKRQNQQTADELAALWKSMQRPISEQDSEISEYLLALVVAISELVIRRELTTDHNLIKAVLDESLSSLAESASAITITLNPSDKALVEQLLDERHITADLVADEAMLRGGCLIERGCGIVDATTEARIRGIVEQMGVIDAGVPAEQMAGRRIDPDRVDAEAKRLTGGNDGD
ncbi:MAG: FliH/SctL family protein [Pseudomonadota bacterium]|nr:FliH/SctL family protein [Pseudomonadota bacterium]